MDDKNVMENILLLEKGVCDLYMHGTIESCTSNVHQAFSHALSDSLAMQDTLYDQMAAKGLVSHRPCRDDKDPGGQEKVPVHAGLTQTQKSCRISAAAFFITESKGSPISAKTPARPASRHRRPCSGLHFSSRISQADRWRCT